MAADFNKKTLRHFYCRDVLWQCFERMSEDLDRGVDELVNEAMRLLAREKGYLPTENDGRSTNQMPVRGIPGGMPARPPGAPPARTAVPPPPAARVPVPPLAMPAPDHGGTIDAVQAPAPPLYLLFQNQKYLVDKDQFIIGRGAKTSDLAIRDGNISRKHAAVIRRNGAYYIKDLGSTNGIDYNGTRVDNKKIEEGDVYSLCDYQLKFTYR